MQRDLSRGGYDRLDGLESQEVEASSEVSICLSVLSFGMQTWNLITSETRVVDVLYSDPSRVIGFVAADVFIFLLCRDSPISGRRTARSVALVIYVLTILMLVFSTVMLYRVTYVILLSLSILTLSIFFGSFGTKTVVKPKTD